MKKIYKSNIEKLSNLPDFPYEAKYEKNIVGFLTQAARDCTIAVSYFSNIMTNIIFLIGNLIS